DDNDDDSKGDDDKADSDDDGNSDADDNKRTDSDDDDENPSFTLKDYDEEEHVEEYESDDDDNDNVFEEEDDDLYKDVDVRSLGAEQEQERKGDEEMTDVDQNTDDSKQSSSVSSDFANQFFILEKTPPSDHEVASLMNIKMGHKVPNTHISSPLTKTATVIPDSSTIASTTIPPIISMISPLPQLTTQLLHQQPLQLQPQFLHFLIFLRCLDSIKEYLPWKWSCLNSNKLTFLHNSSNLSNLNFQQWWMTFLVQRISTITESLENVILAKSYSQPQSTYEVVASLIEFELKKIMLDKLEKSKSYRAAKDHRNLYDALVKSYQLNKDLFDSYGKAYSLKRSREDKDKDEDPPARPDQRLKKKKTIKDVEPSRGSKSKEFKSSSSKGSKSQPKSFGKSVQAEEPVFETADTEMPQDQGGDMENQPNVETTPMDDWFKKTNKPSTPDHA
ncbi:hypothetical protein Tco_0384837, partial [Tanacetum coccineum]